MSKQKKILITIIVFLSIVLSNGQVLATSIVDYAKEMSFSKEYEEYLELSEEQKKNVIPPRMYNIPISKARTTNPLKLAKMIGSTTTSQYSLKTVIPENMVVKDQKETNSCWAFAILAALESNLAIKDYKSASNPIVYDFSERHMEYATSRTFLNGVINQNGHTREVGDGGVDELPIAYLTNGTGAIDEAQMPFENNEDKIDITQIQNKTVSVQLNDTIEFPAYDVETDDLTDIKQRMKQHIMNYGAIYAGIHGASIIGNISCYNNETGSLYCNSVGTDHPMNHAVVIVGWDDNYSKENFSENSRPTNNGAWIIRNSWGEKLQYTLQEMKEFIFARFPNQCISAGYTKASDIPDDVATLNFTNWGFTIENNVATIPVGNNGFMYVSYEDANIYQSLTGIIDAQSEIEYENIYQYDYYGSFGSISFAVPKVYLATVFDKKTAGNEYLTQVAINASETYTCKVYVNPNGTSKDMKDLQLVQLKSGTTETFDAGYHTIEFLNPIKITGDSYVVVLEIEGTQNDSVSTMVEFNFGEYFTENAYDTNPYHCFDNVTIESGKCFATTVVGAITNQWEDTSTFNEETEGLLPDFDTTIKAFTTSKVLESIEITTPPAKTSYVEGQNFDKTGMVVKGKWANGDIIEINDYIVQNGTNLTVDQTNVTISYNGFTVTQPIEVVKNTVESIAITTEPRNTEYYAGEDFDATDMVVEATYKDGTTKIITDYTIKDGQTLKNGQQTVTIEYEGKTTTQEITIKANLVIKLEVISNANKLNYVVGQNFDTEGLIIKATYENGIEKEITASDYIIKDGTNLQENQTTVTIEFEGQTITQAITVVAKAVTSITIKTMPVKKEYIQGKEQLDLTGGVIQITYNDGAKEEISMTSNEIVVTGFDNAKLGKQTITLIYQGKTTQFDIEIIELAKPVNSNFDNMQGNVKRVRAYRFTDKTKKEYALLDMEISNIVTATQNENMEYYYYLSSTPSEGNIANWIKLEQFKILDNKLAFEINTLEVSNYEELANANTIYLYLKEVATRNNMKAEKITKAVSLEISNMNIEEYVDGKKKADVNSDTITDTTPGQNVDNTLALEKIPNAGKSALILFVTLVIILVGRLTYLRYKDIEIK